MEITETAGSSWYDSDARRVLREYESQSEMMDDIWRAFEHGWLPLSMTERREKRDGLPPWKWLDRKVVHTVAFRNTRRSAVESGSQALNASS
jgi:hypothetical protein